jgi:uncharacterized membrane protein YsdA (DUF1294 family)
VNIIAFILFGIDKNIARNGGRRVSELTLHFFELLGGIFAIMIGFHFFKHKRGKITYFLISYIILGFWLYLIWMNFY